MSEQTPAAPTRAQFKPLREITNVREALAHPEMMERMKASLPRHLSPERMLRVCAMAIQKTPKLAECNLWTLLGAMLSLASLGLEPNTPLGHAYLIPFEKRKKVGPGPNDWETESVECNVVIGYRGYIDLMRRSGMMTAIHADVVYEGDEFSFEYGSKMHLRHVPQGAREGRKPLWAYAHVSLSDGQAFEVLPYPEVLAIRDNSEGYKAAQRAKNRGRDQTWSKNPWVAFEHEMAAKTMIRRMAKVVPMSIEFANAAALDAMSEAGKADLAAIGKMSVVDLTALEAPQETPIDLAIKDEPKPEAQPAEQAKPAQQSTPAAQTQAEPQATAQAQPKEEKAADPEEEWDIADEQGEIVAKANSVVSFAAALADRLEKSRDPKRLLAANIDLVRYAMGMADLPAEARAALEALETAANAPEAEVVEMPRNDGRPMLAEYAKLVKEALGRCETQDAVAAFMRANDKEIQALPGATRIKVLKERVLRLEALGVKIEG